MLTTSSFRAPSFFLRVGAAVLAAIILAAVPAPPAGASTSYYDVTRDYEWQHGDYRYGSFAQKQVANYCADMHLSHSSITEVHRGQYWSDNTSSWVNSSVGKQYIWAGDQGSGPDEWPVLIANVGTGTSIRIGAERYGSGTWRF